MATGIADHGAAGREPVTRRPIIALTYSPSELEIFYHWRYMFEGIVAAGGVPLAIDCDTKVEDIATLVGRVDALIIGGGGDVDPELYGGDPEDPTLWDVNPVRDENERLAWEAARAAGIPVLAICRGSQLLTVLLGGDLYADLRRDFDGPVSHRSTEEALNECTHTIDLDPSSELAGWMGASGPEVGVNSQHHQGIRTPAGEVTIVGRSADGLVEAFEWPEAQLVAVQWHPEVLWSTDEHHLGLLRGFVEKAERGRRARF